MIIARKIKLTIVSDNRNEAYSFIRKEKYTQNKALNIAMNHLYFNFSAKEKIKFADETYVNKEKNLVDLISRKKEEYKNANTDKQKKALEKSIKTQENNLDKHRKNYNKQSNDIYKEAIKASEGTNLRDLVSNRYDLMSDTKDRLTQIVKQDFNNDIRDILSGKRVLRTYRKENPLYIRGRSLKFYEENNEYYAKWINGIIFKCVLGVKKQNSLELKSVLDNILNGSYNICDSSIEYSKKNHLILNLSLDIPNKVNTEKVVGRVVGVDLGLKIPAYVALNDVSYIKKSIGTIDDFLRVRTQMQNRRRSLQRALKSTTGGKGREKKLKTLNSLKEKEKNFAKTYNHSLSSDIIKFAKDNKAEQINLELLRMAETQNKSVLRNWSYYQLQQFIEYKAQREGIAVKYVDPYHTSQTCSECGNYEEGQRTDQANFICKKCGFKANADYNAARNIAISTNYIEKKEESEYYKKHNL